MPKSTLHIRNLIISEEMVQALNDYVTDDKEVAPGQLRKRDDWYYLTYLRVVKIKNFNLALWELADTEVDCIRVTAFQFKASKLIVSGGKSEIKEIRDLFDALALKLAGSKEQQEINYDDYYKLDMPIVDLGNILKAYEERRLVADVSKLTLKDMEVKLGSVKRCVVDTNDYGGVHKLLQAPDNNAYAIELSLRDPEKTFILVDLDAQVRVHCNAADADVDVEEMGIECGLKL